MKKPLELIKAKLSKKTLIPLWWLGLFLVFLFLHSAHGINSDEGIMFERAWAMYNGSELYSKAVIHVAPASFYLILWMWKIFGLSYYSIKILAVLNLIVAAIGVVKLAEVIQKNKYNLLISLPFLCSSLCWPIINHNSFNITFIIWSSYFLSKGLNKYSAKYFIWSGALGGVGILFLQHKSLVVFAATLCFLFVLFLKDKDKKSVKAASLYTGFTALPLLLLLRWPIGTIIENLFIIPANTYREYNKTSFAVFYISLIISVVIFYTLKRCQNKKIWYLCLLQFLLLFLAAYQRPDLYHILLIIFPLYALLPISLREIRNYSIKVRLLYSSVIGLSLMTITLFSLICVLFKLPLRFEARELINEINLNCQATEHIYAGPFYPGIYFETKKINPTPYAVLVISSNDLKNTADNNYSLKQYQKTEKILRNKPPECVVMNYEIVNDFNYDKNNPVDNFIKKNYKTIYIFGNAKLMKLQNKKSP